MAASVTSPKTEGRLVARPVYFENLSEGEKIRSDIYTSEGQLLVAAGTLLTSEIRIKIAKRRGFEMVPAVAEKLASPETLESGNVAKLAYQVLAELESNANNAADDARQRLRRRLRAELKVSPLAVGQGHTVQVWTRNLSEQGIGFIARVEIVAERIIVKLPKVSVTAEIMRRRPVQKGFWEYGARFLDRLPNGL